MKKIKYNLQNKSVEQKLTDGDVIGLKLANDANAEVQQAGQNLLQKTNDLKLAHELQIKTQKDAVTATEDVHTKETNYNEMMTAAGNKAMEKYPKDTEKWLSLGFVLSADKTTSTGKPGKCLNLAVTTGDLHCCADLGWDKVLNAKNYLLDMNEIDPTVEANWKPCEPKTCTKSSATIINLTSGKRTYFRVTASNASGNGVPSEPVSKMIP